MNRELLTASEETPAEECLTRLLAFGISGAPVLSKKGELCGVVSWKDLVGRQGPVRRSMSMPATVIPAETPIAEAALLMGEAGHHRLVVVDAEGKPIGIVSSLDVIRALVGLPTGHPRPFPHFDGETKLHWSDDQTLCEDHVSEVPTKPGLVALRRGGAARAEQIVWAEACDDMHEQLVDMLARPQVHLGHLQAWLHTGELRFRYAAVDDISKRTQGLKHVLMAARAARRQARTT